MWLLNTNMLTLHYFDVCKEKYAILSHRWGKHEISFANIKGKGMKELFHDDTLTDAIVKIRGSCTQAQKDGYTWIWIDTCCIDKSSSAELSEAINSMFSWYRDAGVCYVYLPDVDEKGHLPQSSWFTRSWTLQELLAPSNVQFYASSWAYLGSKDDLKYEIARTTSIDVGALQGEPLEAYSIAQRMSWAHERSATRLEDIAYSLLGLFDVNMPLLYGEGNRAFQRLQEEIIRRSSDETIFSWDTTEEMSYGIGAFAEHPSFFRTCRGMRYHTEAESEPHTLTNRGLSMNLKMFNKTGDVYLALLQCVHTQQDMPDLLVGFYLRRLGVDVYQRERSAAGDYRWIGSHHDLKVSRLSQQRVLIRASRTQLPTAFNSLSSDNLFFNFRDRSAWRLLQEATRLHHIGVWDHEEKLLRIRTDHSGSVLSLDFGLHKGILPHIETIEIGIDEDGIPCCLVFPNVRNHQKNRTRPLCSGQDYRETGWIKPLRIDHGCFTMGQHPDAVWAVKGSLNRLRCNIQIPSASTAPSILNLEISRTNEDDSTWVVKIHHFVNRGSGDGPEIASPIIR